MGSKTMATKKGAFSVVSLGPLADLVKKKKDKKSKPAPPKAAPAELAPPKAAPAEPAPPKAAPAEPAPPKEAILNAAAAKTASTKRPATTKKEQKTTKKAKKAKKPIMGSFYSITSMDEPKHQKHVTAIVVVIKVAKKWSTVQLVDTENGDIIKVRHEDLLYCEDQDDEGPSGEDLRSDEEGYECSFNCGAEFRERDKCEMHEQLRHVKKLPYKQQQAYKGDVAIHHVLCWKEEHNKAENANKFLVKQQLDAEEEAEAEASEYREKNGLYRLKKKGQEEGAAGEEDDIPLHLLFNKSETEKAAAGEEEGAAA